MTALLECILDQATVQTRLQIWGERVKAAGLACFDRFLNTLHRWQDETLKDFDGHHRSGFVERVEPQTLRVLKRRYDGLDNPIKLFRRLWLDIGSARLWA